MINNIIQKPSLFFQTNKNMGPSVNEIMKIKNNLKNQINNMGGAPGMQAMNFLNQPIYNNSINNQNQMLDNSSKYKMGNLDINEIN